MGARLYTDAPTAATTRMRAAVTLTTLLLFLLAIAIASCAATTADAGDAVATPNVRASVVVSRVRCRACPPCRAPCLKIPIRDCPPRLGGLGGTAVPTPTARQRAQIAHSVCVVKCGKLLG